jgi:hypothetical protein
MKDIAKIIVIYRRMETMGPDSSMLREIKWQYKDMADGGNGGPLGFDPDSREKDEPWTCREYNYPGHPDSFFQEVRDLMGWY